MITHLLRAAVSANGMAGALAFQLSAPQNIPLSTPGLRWISWTASDKADMKKPASVLAYVPSRTYSERFMVRDRRVSFNALF